MYVFPDANAKSQTKGGKDLYECFSCGTCTAGCPERELDALYSPRKVIKNVLLGMKDFVFANLQEKVKNVKKMLDAEKKFAEEMSFFQDVSKTKSDLEKINPKYIKESDAAALVKNLEDDYAKMKMRLEHEQSVIEKTKNQLQVKRQQIEHLKEIIIYFRKAEKKANPRRSNPYHKTRAQKAWNW